MAKPPKRIEVTGGARLLGITEKASRRLGARLCFGKPVRHKARTVIPVARVTTAGGLGFGSGPGDEGPQDGGGAGGVLGARPIGFIEIDEDRARFRRIVTTADVLQLAGVAGACVLAGLAWQRSR